MTKTIECVWQDEADQLANLSEQQKAWLEANSFKGRAGELVALPNTEGEIEKYAFGLGEKGKSHPMVTGLAATKLSDGCVRVEGRFC